MIEEEEEIQIKCSLLFDWRKAEWRKQPPAMEKLKMGSKERKVRYLTPNQGLIC